MTRLSLLNKRELWSDTEQELWVVVLGLAAFEQCDGTKLKHELVAKCSDCKI